MRVVAHFKGVPGGQVFQLAAATWMLLASPAFAVTGTTGSTSDTDTDTDTDSDSDTDTDTDSDTGDTSATTPTDTGILDTYSACTDCLGAADLAGEPGGSPCNVVPMSPSWLLVFALVALGRRRA
jgi:hypothetical protein